MMLTRPPKKLVLRRETVKELSRLSLTRVVAAGEGEVYGDLILPVSLREGECY